MVRFPSGRKILLFFFLFVILLRQQTIFHDQMFVVVGLWCISRHMEPLITRFIPVSFIFIIILRFTKNVNQQPADIIDGVAAE